MKRHAKLIALSQQHHPVLSLALRMLRQPDADHLPELNRHLPALLQHFDVEEQQFAPLWSRLNRADLHERFMAEHAQLRQDLAHMHRNSDWAALATRLQAHVRFEERELFPALEALL